MQGHDAGKKINRITEEIKLADKIAVGSDFAKKTLIENRVAENKIAVIPYGADTAVFSPKIKEQNNAGFKILFVGNISVRKGCHYLLEAVKQLDMPGIKLTMIGGMEDGYFSEKYGDYFEWLPHVPHDKIASYYNDADIFVFPSLFEGSSLATYEALACGLPVITTANSGSVVRNGKDGFIIPIRNIEAIKEKIMLLRDNKALRGDMARNARRQAKNYTWDIYQRKTSESVKNIL